MHKEVPPSAHTLSELPSNTKESSTPLPTPLLMSSPQLSIKEMDENEDKDKDEDGDVK